MMTTTRRRPAPFAQRKSQIRSRRRLLLESLENRSLLATIASDGFESGNFSGGTGFSGNWTAAGDATVISTSSPHTGTKHAQLRSSTGDLQRAVDVSGLTDVHLQFWTKVNSFEANDKALVSVSPNGSTWTTLLQLNKNQSDNQYHAYDLSVPTSGNTLYIRFDAAMSAADDYWFIDDVAITGTPSGPPQISISDATATEGASSMAFLDSFIQSQPSGLNAPKGMTFIDRMASMLACDLGGSKRFATTAAETDRWFRLPPLPAGPRLRPRCTAGLDK